MVTERRCSFEERREQVRKRHNVSWLNLLSSIESGYYALSGEMEKIPELFREHRLSDVHFLAPGKPMMELIENQVDLAQGAYARVIGRCRQRSRRRRLTKSWESARKRERL